MKLFIFAGGYGSRLGQVTESTPKPMVKIGEKPILWHIMKYYSFYGINEFVVLLGYKGHVIKNYFYNFPLYDQDFTIDLKSGESTFFNNNNPNWKVTLLDTGLDNLKGSRLHQAEKFIDDVNLLTYGDGLSDINIKELMSFHLNHQKSVTISGVRPPSRFGELLTNNDDVISFEEKPQISKGFINGGFMVFNKNILDYLNSDKNCDFEFGPLEKLAKQKEIKVFKHVNSWECIDTQRDLDYMNKIWNSEKAFWKVW